MKIEITRIHFSSDVSQQSPSSDLKVPILSAGTQGSGRCRCGKAS